MRLEVLLSTMNQTDLLLVEKMNIKTDVLIINQSNREDIKELIVNEKKIRMLSFNEKGLSKSRNRAINNSDADICIIADDDLIYKDSYEETVIKAYEKYPYADIIAFDVPSTNDQRPTSSIKEGNVDFLHSMKIASFQITFKRKSILNKNIKFNELFGAGSKYTCGEENILLTECLKNGLQIQFVEKEIAIVDHGESTWYSGFDEKLFKTKGAMFYEMSPSLAYLLVTQFAIRKWKLYRNDIKFITAFKYMLKGISEYKKVKILTSNPIKG